MTSTPAERSARAALASYRCTALVTHSDRFAETGTVTVLLVSGTLVDAPLLRPTVELGPANGVRKPSQVMVDKPMTVRRDRVGPAIGRLAGC